MSNNLQAPFSDSPSLGSTTGGKGKAVFLDVDDTLYDHLVPMRDALTEVLQLPPSFPYDRAYYLFRYYSDLLSEQEGLSAVPDKEKVAGMQRNRFVRMLADLNVPIREEQAEQLQNVYLSRQFTIRPFEGALELIHELNRQGRYVGLITNGAGRHQMKKIQALGLVPLVAEQRIFVSGMLGIAKPDPGIFRMVNKLTGTTPEQCLYIGDSWRNDVAGSLGAGWTTIWFNHRRAERESDLQPKYTAESYAEISRIVLESERMEG